MKLISLKLTHLMEVRLIIYSAGSNNVMYNLTLLAIIIIMVIIEMQGNEGNSVLILIIYHKRKRFQGKLVYY
jgi:hypothetical protein